MVKHLRIMGDKLKNSYVKQEDSFLTVQNNIRPELRMNLAVVVDNDENFMGIITDGDIRKTLSQVEEKTTCSLRAADLYNKTPKTMSLEEYKRCNEYGINPFEGVPFNGVVVLDCRRVDSVICKIYPTCQIDVVDACNLLCPTCPRGRRDMPNTTKQMDINLFKEIVDKVSPNVARLQMYNWVEPFLCENFEEYLEIANNKIPTHLSSNLSLPVIKNLKSIIYTAKGGMVISVSGFTQETHQINHRGSDISVVKKHLKFISDCYIQEPYTHEVNVKFLVFDYNTSEIELFREWVDTLPGIGFFTAPGWDNPKKGVSKNTELQKAFPPTENEYQADTYDKVCAMFYDATIDCNGDAYLCCCKANLPYFKIGSFINDSYNDIIRRRLRHPGCQSCKNRVFETPKL